MENDYLDITSAGNLKTYANYVDTKGNSNVASIYESLQELINQMNKDTPTKKQTKPKEEELELFTLKNAEKLNGKFIKGLFEYEITYVGRNLEHSADNYTWKIKDILGSNGKLTIERRIGYDNDTKVVWSKWFGSELPNETAIPLSNLKDPIFIKELLVKGIEGDFNEIPF
jgi:hypothetical protein